MSDVKKLEEKLNNLEAKLKATFEELEKRLNELAATHTDTTESRFQEIEDLVLLIQVEQIKIVEKLNASVGVGFSDSSSENVNAKVAELEKMIQQKAERLDALETMSASREEAVSGAYRPRTLMLEKLEKILAD